MERRKCNQEWQPNKWLQYNNKVDFDLSADIKTGHYVKCLPFSLFISLVTAYAAQE